MPLAFTRQVSPSIVDCALTHLDREEIDPRRAAAQHAGYEQALKDAGYDVVRLPDLAGDPDAVFVEDTAILLGDHAVIMRPGTPSRAGETATAADGLNPYFTVHHLADGALDGGDVLRIDNRLYVGQSSRSDPAGASALRGTVTSLGFEVAPVKVERCLHLKTAVTYAGRDDRGNPTMLHNPYWVDPSLFLDVVPLAVAADEPFAANVVRLRDRLLMAAGSPKTAAKLRDRGFTVVEVDLTELQKAEAGGSCMSLISD